MSSEDQRTFERNINNLTRFRQFTAQEDDIIRAHARGELTLTKLCSSIHASRDTLERRASELGVSLIVRARPTPAFIMREREFKKPKPEEDVPYYYGGDNPYCITERIAQKEHDLWCAQHGDRRYEELSFKRK